MKWLPLLLLLLFKVAAAEESPYIVVLGVVQDAGYPQAGCYREHCMPGWEDKTKRRTASSIALVVPASGKKYIFDATPHFPEQLYELDKLSPAEKLDGIFLTHAHIGHYTGLMFVGHEAMGARELPVYAMPRMRNFLATNGPWSQLVNYKNITLEPLQNNTAVKLAGGITVTPLKVPHRDEYSETVGYRIEGPDKSAVFIPDIDKWERWDTDIRDVVRSVDYALLDATFFADGEIPGRAMESIPHPFIVESMRLFEDLEDDEKRRVVFIHLNHTNPVLRRDSDAYRFVTDAGYRVAFEGLILGL